MDNYDLRTKFLLYIKIKKKLEFAPVPLHARGCSLGQSKELGATVTGLGAIQSHLLEGRGIRRSTQGSLML